VVAYPSACASRCIYASRHRRVPQPGTHPGTDDRAGQFTAAWVYVLGSIVGAVLAAVLYDRFLSEAEAPE
jgi:hypothetical protein